MILNSTGSNIVFAGWKNQSSLNFSHVLLLVSKCQRTNRRDTETGSDSSVPPGFWTVSSLCCRWLKSVWRVNEQNQTVVIIRPTWSCVLFCWTYCAPGSGRGRAGRRGHWSSRRWCTEPPPPANTQTHTLRPQRINLDLCVCVLKGLHPVELQPLLHWSISCHLF